MDPGERDEWREADCLFASLIELDSNERQRRIAELDTNDAVRAKLAILFESTSRGNRLLDAKSAISLRERLDPPTPGAVDALIGRRFGEWQLVSLLGRGGMATVYRAQRVGGDFEQHAAVKLLSVVLRGPGDHVRFKRERRILAHLQHPHIASLFDGGIAEDGTPYLAMSLIEGERIDAYCERNALSITARVRLMLQVCTAVAYANRQLVVHRDIKPGNILVDAEGRATLLDFGIARLLDADSTDEATVTRAFTPDYAAPEQRAGRHDLGTAVDVYGLAAVLHRLLTSEPPRFDVRGDALPASSVAREAGKEIAARTLRGDLDAILAHALASDPQQRYAGADALADDLMAWLEHRPVHARRLGTWGRTRRLVRRNPAASAMAALCVAIALAGAIAFAVSEAHLRQQATELQAVVDFQSNMLRHIEPSAVGIGIQNKVTAAMSEVRVDADTQRALLAQLDFTGLAVDALDHAILKRALKAIHETLGGQPRVQAKLLQTLASTYLDLDWLDEAEPIQKQALALFRKTFGPGDPSTLSSLRELVELRMRTGKDLDNDTLATDMLALHQRYLGADSFETASARALLGHWYLESGNLARAEMELRTAIARMQQLRGRKDPDVVGERATLGHVVLDKGRNAEAESILRAALVDSREVHGPESVWTVSTIGNLARAVSEQGRFDEALELRTRAYEIYRRTLGELHHRTLTALNNIGANARKQGDYARAEPMQRKAWKDSLTAYGPDYPLTLLLQDRLAVVCLHIGKLDEAEKLLTGALRGWARLNDRPHVARLQRLLGETRQAQGRPLDAEHALQVSWQAAIENEQVDVQRKTAKAFVKLYAGPPADAVKLGEWQERLAALELPAATAPETTSPTRGK